MSEGDEPGLDELERRVDAAFQATRPRRGFEDELWARLRARRPWWHRLAGAPLGLPWTAAGGVALLLVVALGVAGLVRLGGAHRGGGASSSASRPVNVPGPAAQSGAESPVQGRLPAPALAGVAQVVRPDGSLSPLPAGAVRIAAAPASSLPQPAATLPVYSYPAGSGPADGVIVAADRVPAGLTAASYPTRTPGEAFSDLSARAAGANSPAQQSEVTLTAARLVYVAVVAGDRGYLEPAYLSTGTARVGGQSVQVQVLVPALATSVLR